jgi:release factor glutamine methyltransferase
MTAAQCVRDLLADSRLPRLETRMLLQHVLGVPRVWLLTHDTDPVPAAQAARFQALAEQRLAGQPMAYLVGSREFMGHGFHVSPAVLIPRPETELLVDIALGHLARHAAPAVLDLGTGSGAIAVSLALACPGAAVTATDSSIQALAVARDNARRLGARVEFLSGSWYDALAQPGPHSRSFVPDPALAGPRAFDLIVSNPPYIALADPHLGQGDLRFEPSCALTDGADGLAALRAIVQGAAPWLKPQGALWVEHGWDQAMPVRELLRLAGFTRIESRLDLAGIERVSGGYLG